MAAVLTSLQLISLILDFLMAAASSSSIGYEQLSSSTSVIPTIDIERAQKKIKSYVRMMYRRNIHLEPEDFRTLFESGVMDEMMNVLKDEDQKRKRRDDEMQQRKRLRGGDTKTEKYGSVEGHLEASSSDDDDDYCYDLYLNYVDSDEEPNTTANNNNENNTIANNPISFIHASTQTDHESI